jgi:hypothetical protein
MRPSSCSCADVYQCLHAQALTWQPPALGTHVHYMENSRRSPKTLSLVALKVTSCFLLSSSLSSSLPPSTLRPSVPPSLTLPPSVPSCHTHTNVTPYLYNDSNMIDKFYKNKARYRISNHRIRQASNLNWQLEIAQSEAKPRPNRQNIHMFTCSHIHIKICGIKIAGGGIGLAGLRAGGAEG